MNEQQARATLDAHRVIVSGDVDGWHVVCSCGHTAAGAEPNAHLAAVLTAEQQGSDESGEGLNEAERLEAVIDAEVDGTIVTRAEHEGGCPGGGDYCASHCPVPVQDYGDTADLARAILAAGYVRTESAEAALATARRDADELRGRLAAVEALADEWEGWARDRYSVRIYAFRDAAQSLRAALANPSAAQGEAEVGCQWVEAGSLACQPGLRGRRNWCEPCRARADSLATDADGSGQ